MIQPDNSGDKTSVEELKQRLDEAQQELKKCLDKVLDLRVHAAELELSLTALFDPNVFNQIEEITDIMQEIQNDSCEDVTSLTALFDPNAFNQVEEITDIMQNDSCEDVRDFVTPEEEVSVENELQNEK